MLRSLLTASITLLMPARLKPRLLNLLGHRVAPGARIAPSIVLAQRLVMADGARIQFGNLVRCRRLVMRRQAYLDRFNRISGPLSVSLAETAALGRGNVVMRAPHPTSIGPAMLRLGRLSKITSSHLVDCTCSIRIGNYSTVAGAGSQLWTHGYKHASEGPGRYRIDGPIVIGDNVYIGSASVITAGVTLASRVSVGSHSSVSKSLLVPGSYVSQRLRHIELQGDEPAPQLVYMGTDPDGEIVYRKNP